MGCKLFHLCVYDYVQSFSFRLFLKEVAPGSLLEGELKPQMKKNHWIPPEISRKRAKYLSDILVGLKYTMCPSLFTSCGLLWEIIHFE